MSARTTVKIRRYMPPAAKKKASPFGQVKPDNYVEPGSAISKVKQFTGPELENLLSRHRLPFALGEGVSVKAISRLIIEQKNGATTVVAINAAKAVIATRKVASQWPYALSD